MEHDPRFTRSCEFELAMNRAAATRVVEAPWGVVCLRPDLGHCYAENFCWANDGADANAVIAGADEVMGGAGLAHRRVILSEPVPGSVAAAFSAAGYNRERHVYMAWAGGAAPAHDPRVEEISIESLARSYDRYLADDPDTGYARDPDVRAQLCAHQLTHGSAGAQERCFGVVVDGEAVAFAKLWTRGSECEIEDVVCLAPFRGRGFGRAVTAAAARAALDGGCDFLFIPADSEDWPRQLYARIGFEPVGELAVFTLPQA